MFALNVIVSHVATVHITPFGVTLHHFTVQFALVIVGAVTVGFGQLLAVVQYAVHVNLVAQILVAPFFSNVATYCL